MLDSYMETQASKIVHAGNALFHHLCICWQFPVCLHITKTINTTSTTLNDQLYRIASYTIQHVQVHYMYVLLDIVSIRYDRKYT